MAEVLGRLISSDAGFLCPKGFRLYRRTKSEQKRRAVAEMTAARDPARPPPVYDKVRDPFTGAGAAVGAGRAGRREPHEVDRTVGNVPAT